MRVEDHINDGKFQYKTANYIVTTGTIPGDGDFHKEMEGYIVTNLHTGLMEAGTTSMPEALRIAEQLNSMLEEDFHTKFRVSRVQQADDDPIFGIFPGGNQ